MTYEKFMLDLWREIKRTAEEPVFSMGDVMTDLRDLYGYKKYRAVTRIRRDPALGKVREEVAARDGEILTVVFGWEFDEDEREAYRKAGDVAWTVEEPRDFPVHWVATGDLEFIDPLPLIETRSAETAKQAQPEG